MAARVKREFAPEDFEPRVYVNHAVPYVCSIQKPQAPEKGTWVQRYDGWRWWGGYQFVRSLGSSNGFNIWLLELSDGSQLRWPSDRVRIDEF